MPGNLVFDTNTLIQVVQNLKLAQSWLLDKFFTNMIAEPSEFVSIDVDVGKRRMSPFCSPLVEGKLVESRRYQTNTFKPPYIKDKRAPDLRKPVRRMIGERIGGELDPEVREQMNLEFELNDQIDMLTRRLAAHAANSEGNPMKKLFAALAAGVVLLALSACGATAPTTQNAAQLVAAVQVKAQKVCTVSVPFLASMTAMRSQLSADGQGYLAVASDKVNAACDVVANAGASAGPISTDKIAALVNDGVPALIKVIDGSSLDKNAKSAAEIALTAAQLAVSSALADYLSTPAVATPDPASEAVAS